MGFASLRRPFKLMSLLTSSHVEAASTLAVIASSNEPLLFLADDLRIIAASASFCRTFQIEPASVPGRQLCELGAGEWAMPKLISLLKATASGSAEIAAYEIDLVRKEVEPRYLVVNARKLDDGDNTRVQLLLAVSDVTFARAEARQKDDLIREKSILLQEVQHRVANSLQIIASVLMQSAGAVRRSSWAPSRRASSGHVDCRRTAPPCGIQPKRRGAPTLFHSTLRKPCGLDDYRP